MRGYWSASGGQLVLEDTVLQSSEGQLQPLPNAGSVLAHLPCEVPGPEPNGSALAVDTIIL